MAPELAVGAARRYGASFPRWRVERPPGESAKSPRRKRGDMSSNPVQVFIAAYQSEDGAGAALKDFRAMHREGSIELFDAAVAVHTADGKVKIEETADPSGKTWGKRGPIAGGIAGRPSRRASSPGHSSAGRAAASGASSATRASRTRI